MVWKIKDEEYLEWESEFDSAHFLFFDYQSKCRCVHGHTWKVKVFMRGVPNDNGVIFDFNHLSELVRNLDHKLIVPKRAVKGRSWSGKVELATNNGATIKTHDSEVVVIDEDNATSEMMAKWFIKEIIGRVGDNVSWIKVCIMEDPRSMVCSEAINGGE